MVYKWPNLIIIEFSNISKILMIYETLTVSEILQKYRLTGLSRQEQTSLEAIWESLTTSIPAGIDKPGVAFILKLNHQRSVDKYFGRARRKSVESSSIDQDLPPDATVWAFHSNNQAGISSILMNSPNFTWKTLKCSTMPLWCREKELLKTAIEKLARTEFQKNKDPMEAVLWFCILKKEKVLAGLFKSVKNIKMADFFSNDFKTDRWRQER